jgi:hypothetical protein
LEAAIFTRSPRGSVTENGLALQQEGVRKPLCDGGRTTKANLGTCVGRLADEDVVRLNRAILVFLGIASRSAQ